MGLLSSWEEVAGLANGGGGDKAPPSEKGMYCISMCTILIGEHVDTLRCACYCAPRLTTKGQTRREAGAQSYGPLNKRQPGHRRETRIILISSS
jgi:hypothetical protein